ncbi:MULTISPECIES: DNA repair protein RecO [Bifidobacterium]|jgi:DNA repair protein RecO (recombination protein O)|uniref:DNA repair protein RecO n=1 Tax=Bifidobacterium tibiigranuli TaxID=2172043 RepID=A0A5N6S443_9BIFI|nr:DNA repair protein RecO [Bifidobacterium tibiigranuli]KAE8128366.1 DNA repair protein RecO [Bifidobacterium tibiigranuli]KAE8128619.1 DNA repair protein RecO [Bifidobacterium tibiigranuli]MCH3974885.1 DNA repair protein RecO [Bifidobacterium tibiigranuli]MCH4189994.1 DNA repair protein RecO [Bifidobacterium tibiigranuli]MCH4202645.1 DNA repair protein RecO [Bifidobacterium tibiigranuli]
MALYRDEGVVLRAVKLGEADRIITVLTKEHGKIRAVAKGVRRVKSRFGGRLEPFMRVDLLIAEGRSLDVISQAASIGAYAAEICLDFEAYSAANVIVETVDKLVSTEHEPSRGQYMLLIGALNALARHAHDALTIGESYVMRALAEAGWTPRMESCVVCGRHDELGFFSVRSGGMMCAADRTPDAVRLDSGAREQLSALVDGAWSALDGEGLRPEVSRIVEDWGEYYLERPIRSLRLLHS